MSTNRSVGRTTATQDKVRSTSTQNAARSTSAQEEARSAATHEHGRPARKSKKDRSPGLCAFAFADGRQCRTPRCSGHLHYCYFHAQKEAESLAAQQVGQDISRFLPSKLLTACDLGVALSRTFCAVAQGQIKPKVASTLAYLAQTMLQSIPLAQHEYIETFNTNVWHNAVRASFRFDDPPNTPVPQRAQPATPAGCHSERSEEPAFSVSPASAPSPHTPLPATRKEFFLQVLAGSNSSPSETPTPPESEPPTLPDPAPEPGPSASSPSSAPSSSDPAPAQTPCAQPAPPSPAPPPTPTNSQPTPAPTAPPSLPPTFGAPANWDVLIPPKPRRKFPRRW